MCVRLFSAALRKHWGEWMRNNTGLWRAGTKGDKPVLVSGWILPRASQTAQRGWRLQCCGQGGAAARCGLGWQQTHLCNALSWIRSEMLPWHLLQMGAAAGCYPQLWKLGSVSIPSDRNNNNNNYYYYYCLLILMLCHLVQSTRLLQTLDFSFLQIIFHCLSAVGWCSHHRAKGVCTGLGAALCPA